MSGKWMMYPWSIPIMTRDELIAMVDKLDREGGFARSLGQACLLADEDNLAILLKSFPHIFGSMKLKTKLYLVE